MKRPLLIAFLGVALGLGAYGFLYAARTASHRALEQSCGPELAWLKSEFQLDEAHFEQIRKLHEAYKPVCAEYCRQIDEKNRQLADLLSVATHLTPEIQNLVTEANALRTECHTVMLRHFFQVSQAMPAEQGRRYLLWMHSETLTPTHETMLPQARKPAGNPHH